MKPEHFAEACDSWRRMLAAVTDPNDRLKIFCEAAGELAAAADDKTVAADELAAMAIAYLPEFDTDQIQAAVADAFAKAKEQPRTGNGKARDEPPPLPYVDLSLDLVEREWLVPERIPMRNVSLMSGEGAMGKSLLLMQLSGAIVLGRDWLGTLPMIGPVLYVSAEEDHDEVRRRMEAVAIHYGSSRIEMIEAGLRVLSFAGEDAILGLPGHNDIIKPTPLFERIERDALQLRPKLIALDASADVFGGKENDRAQTRQFVTLQRGLAIKVDAAVMLIAHPSLTGIATDTGLSGNTAWHNSVRARMYFKPAPGDDASLRVLEVKKNNYGPQSENILLRWKNGVYVVEPGKGTLERLAAEQEVDHLFLKLLRRHQDVGRNVTDKKGTSYAPALLADEPEARAAKVSNKALAEAMTRLFAAGKIRVITEGPTSKPRTRIIEAEGQETAASTNPSTNVPPAFHQPSTNVPPLSPHTPHVGGRGKRVGGNPAPPTNGSPEGAKPAKPAIRIQVVGSTPPETPCLHCRQTGDVKRVIDASEVGGKSETLHEGCAAEWFAMLADERSDGVEVYDIGNGIRVRLPPLPRTADGYEILCPELDDVACRQCGKSHEPESQRLVHLIRLFKDAQGEPLHEDCAGTWFGK